MVGPELTKAMIEIQQDWNLMLNDRPLMDRIHAQYLEASRKYPFSSSSNWWEPLKPRDSDAHLGAVRD